MNSDKLDVAAEFWYSGAAPDNPTGLTAFKAGAQWHEDEMVRQGLIIKLVGGPAGGKVMPRPVVGQQITFRQTRDDGIVFDHTYQSQDDGAWTYAGSAL